MLDIQHFKKKKQKRRFYKSILQIVFIHKLYYFDSLLIYKEINSFVCK